MAHLWLRETGQADSLAVWSALEIPGDAVDLSARPPRPVSEQSLPGAGSPVLRRLSTQEPALWVLVTGVVDVRVNGLMPLAGIRVLHDRDEIRIAGESMFFSTETLAAVMPFRLGAKVIFCGRCRQRVEDGQDSVRCPQCGIRYHQTAELPCWTYAATCAMCPCGTALGTGYSWVPEE